MEIVIVSMLASYYDQIKALMKFIDQINLINYDWMMYHTLCLTN